MVYVALQVLLCHEIFELAKNGLGNYVGKYDLKDNFTSCRAFNFEAYVIVKPKNITLALLVIQKIENGVYKAFQKVKRGMRSIVKFQNEERAQSILSELFNNPLYHSHEFYRERLHAIRECRDWKKAKSYKEFKDIFKNIYDESLAIAEIFKRGSEEFGCQKRYLENLSIPNRNQNLYLANFGDFLFTSNAYTINYQDGNHIVAKKIGMKTLTKEDFNIVIRGMNTIKFENNNLNFYSSEIEGFEIINASFAPWANEMDLEIYQQGVNLIVWGMLSRRIFHDIPELEQFLQDIEYPQEMKIKERYRIFTSFYLDKIKSLGFTVTELPSSDFY